MLPITQAADLIQQDFQLDTLPQWHSEAELRAFLIEVIQYLLDHQMERLLNILYRLDIDEQRVGLALLPYTDQTAAAALADLVWERELQKVQSRAQYQTTADEEEDITPW